MPAPLLPESNLIRDGLPVLSIILLHSQRQILQQIFLLCVPGGAMI